MQELDPDERGEFARLIVSLLDDWGVSAGDQVALLALPAGTRAGVIRQHRQGKPLPDIETVHQRAEHLIGIADALRTSFPLNARMGGVWMNRGHRQFDHRTPLQVMIEDGPEGVIQVRAHLDCAFDWDLSGSRSESLDDQRKRLARALDR
jgi:hypothetical protein